MPLATDPFYFLKGVYMPELIGHNLSYQLPTGRWLFKGIDIKLTDKLTALIGRNGVGKSVLMSVLSGKVNATSGRIKCDVTIGYYSQLPSELLTQHLTIAQYLDIAQQLEAIAKIEQGQYQQSLFDTVGDDWQLAHKTEQSLFALGIDRELHSCCSSLSGGQLALLQLYKLFSSKADILLLDEPSNHLDAAARKWLIKQMHQFDGGILLVSHDRSLLNEVESVYQLTSIGLEHFVGNFRQYCQQVQLKQQALIRQEQQLRRQQRHIECELQTSKEKAKQRATRGKKLVKSGSQPKVAMDAKKNKAGQQQSTLTKRANIQRARVSAELTKVSQMQEQIKKQTLSIGLVVEHKRKPLLTLEQVILPRGTKIPLSFCINSDQHCYLSGQNGIGKSTLLKVIHGAEKATSGAVRKNTETIYLDQHFTLLALSKTVLTNLIDYCPHLSEQGARTLLAGVGFRGQSVFQLVNELSGGEKMKLVMLMVSHSPACPLLLLDEPDNHLDIESKQLLAASLSAYQGAFILVSHDPFFVDEVSIDCTVNMLAKMDNE